MLKIPTQYVDDAHFIEWLSSCFDETTQHATLEELAEFAFGDVKTAIAAYNEEKRKNHP